MAKEVEFEITDDGQIRVEFSGFPGDACIDEAEKLEKILSGLGLDIELKDFEKKDAERIRRELGIEGETRETEVPRDTA